jgi:sugar phosphate isomerase/epimerase
MPLGVTIQPLGRASEALDAVASLGLAGVQFDASDPELRPREMSESARRDLVAALRRRGLAASGVDCFVPIERFVDPARVERAMEAVRGSIALAESLGRVPVCLWLPAASVKQLGEELVREAQRRGVPLADFTWPDAGGALGIDPAAVLSAGGDPCAAVSTAGSRVAAARVVDLLQGGLRGPIGQAGACRLDALAYRLALEVSGFQGLPVIDCRQWTGALEGVRACADRWVALLPTVGGARP